MKGVGGSSMFSSSEMVTTSVGERCLVFSDGDSGEGTVMT